MYGLKLHTNFLNLEIMGMQILILCFIGQSWYWPVAENLVVGYHTDKLVNETVTVYKLVGLLVVPASR